MKRELFYTVMFTLLLAVACFVSAPVTARAESAPLVTTDWLASNMGAKNLVILDVRTETNYGVGHIPGSFNIPYAKWEILDEDRECQLMPTPEKFTEMLQAIGVNSDSHVVVYDHGNSIGDATKGATAVWILEAMGHSNVSYLNGGFTKWTFEGRIIDNKKPQASPGNFVAALDSSKVAALQDVVAKIDKGVVLVDARNSNQHFGDDKRGDVDRYGHIPGSISLPAPFLNNAGANRAPATIRDAKQLAEMARGVGIPADKNTEIIVYCNTGQFAGMDYVVLHDILGYKNVSVYDGSMLEYSADEDLPLVRFAWGSTAKQ